MEDYTIKFKNHKLIEILNMENIKIFEFRQDNSSNHYQRWIIDKGTLIITGDNGSSIYKWNDSKITLEFLAKCNLGYFNEKCLSDKDGSNQKVYCPEHSEKFMKEIASDIIYDNLEEDIEGWEDMSQEERFNKISHKILEELDIEEYELKYLFSHENIQEAVDFMRKSDNNFMFGSDSWEYFSGLEVLTWTPKLHLTALRVAYSQNQNAF